MTVLELWRRSRNMKQTELAAMLGYQTPYIATWLEKQKPSPDDIGPRLRLALEHYVGLSVDELLSEVPPWGGARIA